MVVVEPVLSVRDLQVRIGTGRGVARVVNGISYDLHRGETLAIVGESGSGKTVSALALLRLLPEPPAEISGEVLLGGRRRFRKLLTTSRRPPAGNAISSLGQRKREVPGLTAGHFGAKRPGKWSWCDG
jgi:ABC-type glutathione transport system ATPase component